ncbi:hypothetical protein ABK040_009754 [Willaertia magna]
MDQQQDNRSSSIAQIDENNDFNLLYIKTSQQKKIDENNNSQKNKSIGSISLPFKEKVKLFKCYGHEILFVTITNQIYFFTENNFSSNKKIKKINDYFGNIVRIEYLINDFIIFNDKNDCFYNFLNKNCNSIKINFKFLQEAWDFLFLVTNENKLILKNFTIDQKIEEILTPNENDIYLNTFNLNIKDLQCGARHAVILDHLGDVYSIYLSGDDYRGQLGNLNNYQTEEFKKIELPFKVKRIKCGLDNTFLFSESGELYGAGCNQYSKLGQRDLYQYYNVEEFTKIKLPNNINSNDSNRNNNIKDIYFDSKRCIAIDEENRIYVAGNNEGGIFGFPHVRCLDIYEFREIEFFKTKKQFINVHISCNFFNSCIMLITSDYEVSNSVTSDYNLLGTKCLQKVYNNKATDISINFLKKNNF